MLDNPNVYNGANSWPNYQMNDFGQTQPFFQQPSYQNPFANSQFPSAQIPNLFNQYQQMGSQQGQTNLRYNKAPERGFNQMQFSNAGIPQYGMQQSSTQNGFAYPGLKTSQDIFNRY